MTECPGRNTHAFEKGIGKRQNIRTLISYGRQVKIARFWKPAPFECLLNKQNKIKAVGLNTGNLSVSCAVSGGVKSSSCLVTGLTSENGDGFWAMKENHEISTCTLCLVPDKDRGTF